jgi:hypothetical protein
LSGMNIAASSARPSPPNRPLNRTSKRRAFCQAGGRRLP